MTRPDMTKFRIVHRDASGKTLAIMTGEVTTNQGSIEINLHPGTVKIGIEWLRAGQQQSRDYDASAVSRDCTCTEGGWDGPVSECVVHHKTQDSHYGVTPGYALVTDHRFDADRKGVPCQVILNGLDPANACGRDEVDHRSSAWDEAVHHKSDHGAAGSPTPGCGTPYCMADHHKNVSPDVVRRRRVDHRAGYHEQIADSSCPLCSARAEDSAVPPRPTEAEYGSLPVLNPEVFDSREADE